MRHYTLCIICFAAALLPVRAYAAVFAGEGTARVTQSAENAPEEAVTGDVSIVAAWARNLEGDHRALVRFQFIRPDNKAVAYTVISVPLRDNDLLGFYDLTGIDASVLYYEQRPNTQQRLFIADEWSGELEAMGSIDSAGITLTFKYHVRDWGPDRKPFTADDQARTVTAGTVSFSGTGNLAGVDYYYTYEDESYHSSGDIYIVYDDGCSDDPGDDDYYDDEYYDDSWDDSYDSSYYDDSYEDSTSCDGDVFDDDDDDDDWGDDWGDSGDSGDDWDWGGDDWDDDDTLFQVRPMSWAAGMARTLLPPLRRPLRMLPLALGLIVLLGVRWRGRKSAV